MRGELLQQTDRQRSRVLGVCVALRGRYPGLPVVLYTGAFRRKPADRMELESQAGAAVVFKDIRDRELDHLQKRVKALLASARAEP